MNNNNNEFRIKKMINYVYLDKNNNNNQFGIEKNDKLCLFG